MLETMMVRKARLEEQGKKGFTLMEMLIVIAIIAILIAIAIPIFTAQLEKAREATDEANIRSKYAECVTAVMTGAADANSGVTLTRDGNNRVTSAVGTVAMTQQTSGFVDGSTSISLGGTTITSNNFNTGTATITVNADGTTTISIS